MNGDGLPDLVFCANDNSKLQVALNTGSGFEGFIDWTTGTWSIRSGTSDIWKELNDMNRDGFPDSLDIIGDTICEVASYHPDAPSDTALIAVTNSAGGEHSLFLRSDRY